MLSNGSWQQLEADRYHQSSPALARYLASYLNPTIPVVDFGCGTGFYISELESVGFKCIGVEGFKLNNFLTKNIMIHDLTTPFYFLSDRQVLSFETGEHLDRQYEQVFLDTLTRACGSKLIMSWATEGQPGVGHINCRNHDYIIKEIQLRGFKLLIKDTDEIRKHVDLNCDWLERNLLIFNKV